jgi:non-specific serine/threonine protein kinase/serine/threonine-protein kinase
VTTSLTEKTLFTEQGRLVGTPEYMSPEQAEMTKQDIDTRSDVYSLGVLLYVLLTGTPPLDRTTLERAGFVEILRVVREQEPPRPSVRLSSLANEAIQFAVNRHTNRGTLARLIRGDLDWIVMRSLEKNRNRRYSTAAEFAADIRRHLNNEPVQAGPPTMSYKLRKFVRRNRASLVAASFAIAALIFGSILATYGLMKARLERDRVVEEHRARVRAQAIAGFFRTDVLGSIADAKAGEETLSFVLDTGAEKLKGKFINQPLTKAWLEEALGCTYLALGDPYKAEGLLFDAQKVYQDYSGENHPDTLGGRCLLSMVYDDQGRYQDAEALWKKILRDSLNVYAEEFRLDIKNSLALTYYHLGEYKEAELLYNEILEAGQNKSSKVKLPLDSICRYKCNLARIYAAQGLYKKAEDSLHKALAASCWDSESKWRLCYTKTLGNVCRNQGHYEDAEKWLSEALEKAHNILGDEHIGTVGIMYSLAQLRTDQDDYEDANDLFDHILETGRLRLSENHPTMLEFVNGLAVLRTKQKQYNEAESLLNRVIKDRRRELGDDHPDTLESKNDSAVLYKEQERYEEAEKYFLEAVKGRRLKLGDTHPHTIDSVKNLIDLYEAWNKPEKAEEWRAILTQNEAKTE